MNLIKNKSYQFALRIVSFYRQMQDQNEYVLSKQLLRAGTSIGANTPLNSLRSNCFTHTYCKALKTIIYMRVSLKTSS
jgi:NifU-like protein involved in Fe-S cluster formation